MTIKKDIVRDTVLIERRQLSVEDYMERSLRVVGRLRATHMYAKAKSVLLYMSKEREVFTHGLVAEALKEGKGVALPRTNRKTDLLEIYLVDDAGKLTKGSFGVEEPVADQSNKIEVSQLDLLVIPGAAFDRQGFRLGWGKGYYDKLLAGLKNCSKTCALAFGFQVLRQIPHEAHDVPVDFIITESEIIDCQNERRKSGSIE